MNKEIIVGTYYFGWEQAQLILRPGTGGEIYFLPEKDSIPRIKIGADETYFHAALEVLIHEVFEYCITKNNGRYSPSLSMTKDHSAYLFSFDHPTFSDCCAKTAEFLASAMSDFKREWGKYRAAKLVAEREKDKLAVKKTKKKRKRKV